MKIRFTPTALRDLETVHAYVAQDNPVAATETVDAILNATHALARHPQMGRAGRVAGTRELVVRPFIIAYRAKGAVIEILAIIHGARRWPASF